MTRKNRKRAERHMARRRHVPDGTEGKRFPNGISATVRAIYTSWHAVANGEPAGAEFLTPLEFCDRTNFAAVYGEVLAHYPGISKRATTSLHSMLDDLDAGNRTNIAFHHLRTLAQFVGLDTGLFLLFTQFVSNERKDIDERGIDPNAQTLEMIRSLRSFFSRLEEEVVARGGDGPIFTKSIPSGGHIVDIEALKLWSDLYATKVDES